MGEGEGREGMWAKKMAVGTLFRSTAPSTIGGWVNIGSSVELRICAGEYPPIVIRRHSWKQILGEVVTDIVGDVCRLSLNKGSAGR